MNQISSPKSVDPPIPTQAIPSPDPELEPIAEERVKSKIENLERQVKEMKEVHIEGVRLSDICLYLDLEYRAKFRVPAFQKYDGNGCSTGSPLPVRNNNVPTRQE